jgi:pimeloyl-ACP methyl ester carboxylesterase
MPDEARIAALPRRTLIMNDGAEISMIDMGSGPALIILPSWTNSAAQYHHQVTGFASGHRVIAVEMRGSGRSAKVGHGLRVSRFSADLREISDQLGLDRFILMGHSMGCSVIWSYLDLFGPDRVAALVFVDQTPAPLVRPWWSADEAGSYGAIQTAADVLEFADRLAGPDGVADTVAMYRRLFTATFPPDEFDWAVSESLATARRTAATVFLDHATRDWHDVVSRIRVPTLVVGAEKSFFPVSTQEWIAGQIPGARLEIFAEKDGGSHFMCFENPTRFNAVVGDFLASLDA